MTCAMSRVPPEIFKAYDIRGVVGRQLSAPTVELIGRAIGTEVRNAGGTGIAIGRDGRLSGPELSQALAQGLRASGVDVHDIGMVTTPMAYFAAHHLGCGSAVAVTGSHNPPDYNGLKMVVAGTTLSGDAVQALRARIERDDFAGGSGAYRTVDVREAYLARVVGDVKLARPMKIVVDCGNGVAGSDRAGALPAARLRGDRALLRRRRHVSEPSPRSDPAEEPAGRDPDARFVGRRARPRVRRRRRPPRRGDEGRRDHLRRPAADALRRRRARAQARAPRSSTT